MFARRWFSFPVMLAGIFISGLTQIVSVPGRSQAEGLSREQQIADLERQIQDLTKKLEELRKESAPTPKQEEGLPANWVSGLKWRCIGPASMGGRIVALAVYEADPSTYWIATASGGLLKTTNNGTTFEHQFDREASVSLGDVCVAPSDPKIVWVGTGENNPRNSVSCGDGVYKSSDGGKSWKNMGLKKSFQIGRIAIHPKNPDIVYVGALGRLYGPSQERGLFKTTDGGKTWEKILFIDDKTGIIDVQMHPSDPETLLVAAWERQRDGFDSHRGEPPLEDGYDAYDPIKKWGPGSGIYKTTNGGKTFAKLTKGLPTVPLGRIGLDYYRKDPKVVYAIIDSQKIGMGTPPTSAYMGIQGEDVPGGAKLVQISRNSPATKAGLQPDDIIKAIDKKEIASYAKLTESLQNRKVGDKLTLTVLRGQETKEIVVTLENRPTPPRNLVTRPYSFWYGGQRENVQDSQGPDSFQYGGVYRSADGGETWTRLNSVNPRPMYFSQVRVDPTDEKYLYVLGITLYRSADGGKTFKPDGNKGVHPDQHALWIDPRDGRHMLLGCDGGVYDTHDRMNHWDFRSQFAIGQFYHVAVDSRKPYRAYGGLQDNGSWGGPSHSLTGLGPINEDWIEVGGGDGFVCRVDPHDPDLIYFESQDGAMQRRNLRTGERGFMRPRQGQGSYRFNWNTPFILSSHNSKIYYAAGNVVFRSLKQGSELRAISPDIARTKRGSGTALAESPRNAEVLWAGTDDGYLWISRDGGAKWTNVTDKVGLPGPRWVSTIEASRFVEGRAYVVFDGHRSDDDEPYVYVTEDYGATWKSLRGNLPTGWTRVLREDIENPNLLYLGTEFAVWASLDRGKVWTRINNNLPTVAVHELALHPTAGEMVAATHGRSLWVLDVTALRQMKPSVLKAPATLFQPATALHWRAEPGHISMYGDGSRRFIGENPPSGAQLYFGLTKKAEKAGLKIYDYTGKSIREFDLKGEPGLHRLSWDMTRPAPAASQEGSFFSLFSAPIFRGRVPTPPGMYRVVLTVDGVEYSQGLRVENDPGLNTPTMIAEEAEEERRFKEEKRLRRQGLDD